MGLPATRRQGTIRHELPDPEQQHLAPVARRSRDQKAPNIGDHTLFSIMTTEPNGVVQPIHEKAMPVLLMTPEDVDRWLAGKTLVDALEMQKPAPDDAIRIANIEKTA